MASHRFFVPPDQIVGQQVFLRGEQARQIHGVLRLRPPQTIVVLDNQGWQYDLRLENVSGDRVVGAITARARAVEPVVQITLCQSMLKKDNFEWILQKGTELGITAFVPVISQRSIVRQAALKQNKAQRWQRILAEAAEQSQRGRVPTLSEPVSLEEAIAASQTADLALIPWEEEARQGLLALLRAMPVAPRQIALFIGPEGGYAPDEIDLARAAGVVPVTLGPRILRAETAAVAATALLMGELDELQ
jgi:16S rRNA (uracil1498-N3)-methyltransferase